LKQKNTEEKQIISMSGEVIVKVHKLYQVQLSLLFNVTISKYHIGWTSGKAKPFLTQYTH